MALASMSVFLRAMWPAAALGLGTWLGMGRPDSGAAWAAGSRVIASVAGAAHQLAPTVVPPPPPLERGPSPDGAAVPDLAPPWPQLNPQDTAERAWLVAEGPAHPPGDARRLVTFTFDDGPFPETAPTVLRILQEHGIRATFFFIGKYLVGDDRRAAETRMWARRIADAGHLVGNHTLEHKELTAMPRAAAMAQIDDAAAAIETATGRRPVLFRPPYGATSPWLEAGLRERRLDLLLWNIDVDDMKRQDPDDIVKSLEGQLEYKDGGVVLLHDMHWPSVKAFNRLLRWLDASRWDPAHPQRPGWSIVDLPEYLRETAAHPQPFASRSDLERARKEKGAGGLQRRTPPAVLAGEGPGG